MSRLPLLPVLPVLPVPISRGAPLEVKSEFRIRKDKLGSRSDNEVREIYSGWDWFFKTPLLAGNVPKSLEDIRDKVQLVQIGAIGDQSCFYHSTCKALSTLYQNGADVTAYGKDVEAKTLYRSDRSNAIERGRQLFCDNFRRAIAMWLFLPAINPVNGQTYTLEEASAFLNVQPGQMMKALTEFIGDPMRPVFDQFLHNVKVPKSIVFETLDVEANKSIADPTQYKYTRVTTEQQALFIAELAFRYYNPNTHKEAVDELVAKTVNRDTTFMEIVVYPRLQELKAAMEAGGVEFKSDEGIEATKQLLFSLCRFTPQTIEATLASKSVPSFSGEPSLPLDFASVNKFIESFGQKVVAKSGETEVNAEGKRVPVPPRRSNYFLNWTIRILLGIVAGYSTDEILAVLDYKSRLPSGRIDAPDFLVNYITAWKAIVIKFRDIFGDPNRFGYEHYRLARGADGNPILPSAQDYVNLFPVSINPVPKPHYFTKIEWEQLLTADPRTGYKSIDPDVMKLPININYFMYSNGLGLYNVINNIESLQIKNLLNYIVPKMITSGSRKGYVQLRRDAGEDDVITIMPFIVSAHIYIVNLYWDHIHVHRLYRTTNPAGPSIMINWLGGHFEIVGVADEKGVIATAFAPDHPLVVAADEYLRRFNLTPADERDPRTPSKIVVTRVTKMYNTLAVSKVPELPVGYTQIQRILPFPERPGQPGKPLQIFPPAPLLPQMNDRDLQVALLVSQGYSQADAEAIYPKPSLPFPIMAPRTPGKVPPTPSRSSLLTALPSQSGFGPGLPPTSRGPSTPGRR